MQRRQFIRIVGANAVLAALTASTPAYLWLVTKGNRRAQQVEAGRA